MNNTERREKELPFIADDADWVQMKRARRLTQALNTVDRANFETIRSIVRELFGKSDETTFINPPFYCDYGANIEVGKNFFANYNCVVLDNAKVKIGDNCLLAPNVAIYTAGHPLHPMRAARAANTASASPSATMYGSAEMSLSAPAYTSAITL